MQQQYISYPASFKSVWRITLILGPIKTNERDTWEDSELAIVLVSRTLLFNLSFKGRQHIRVLVKKVVGSNSMYCEII